MAEYETRKNFHLSRKWLRPVRSADGQMSSILGRILAYRYYDSKTGEPTGESWLDAELSLRDCYRQVNYNLGANNQGEAGDQLIMLRKLRQEIDDYIVSYEEAASHLPKKQRRDNSNEEL